MAKAETEQIDNLSHLIKAEIRRQYGSVAKFSQASGIPYGTLGNALVKGFGGTAFDTVSRVCGMLGIKQPMDSEDVLLDAEYRSLYEKIRSLDLAGIQSFKSVLDKEYNRCTGGAADPDEKLMKKLINKAKANKEAE